MASSASITARASAAFRSDSESRESVEFQFDDDPEEQVFSLDNGEGQSATDFNGRLEGSLRLDVEAAARLLAAQHSTQGWLRLHAVSDGHWGAVHRAGSPPGSAWC